MSAVFSLTLPAEIRFGRGTALASIPELAGLAPRLLVVHGADAGRAGWLLDGLRAAGVEVRGIGCGTEPDLDMLEAAVTRAREFRAGAVIGCGGGAALDLAKAVAALANEAHPPLDYLEVVGSGRKLGTTPLPFVAIPTTAGTGAEMTRNAVIGVPAHRRKVSLRDPRMLARLAVIDPGLTDGCPRPVTMASGLDALVQVIEPYLSSRANPVTDALCRDAIPMALAALGRLAEAEDREARDAMAHVSMIGGIALANAGLGAVHGLAGPLGGVTGAAHGAICGRLLPHVLAANAAALAADHPVKARLAEIGRMFAAHLGVHDPDALDGWLDCVGLPRLGALGLDPADIPAVAAMAGGSSSMRGNPVDLDESCLIGVMRQAW